MLRSILPDIPVMKKKNLIVFDIDGTLTDTVDIHQSSFKNSLRYIGVQNFNDSFGTYTHHTDSHIARVIFETATNRVFDHSTIKAFEAFLHQQIEQHEVKEIKGARQFVDEISAHTDFGICYATGSLLKPAGLKLQRIGIRYETTQLVASNETEEREGIVRKAIRNAEAYYGVEKFDRIISFGDGLWDLKTAANLSLEFIGIGSKNEQVLRDHGMLRHYADLEKINIAEL